MVNKLSSVIDSDLHLPIQSSKCHEFQAKSFQLDTYLSDQLFALSHLQNYPFDADFVGHLVHILNFWQSSVAAP